ncbi:ABC transporter ATP-binding protein [Clostridium carnis]
MSEDNNKKKNRSTLTNLKFLISNAWKWDKSVFLQLGLFTIFTSLTPFIGILLPKFLLDELTGEKRINILIIILIVFFIISAIVNYSAAHLKGAYFPKLINIRFNYITMLSEKCMVMDFKNTEDPIILNNIESAINAVNNNDSGIEGTYHRLFGILGKVVAFIGYIAIVVTLNPLILLYLVVNVLIVYFLTLKVKEYEYSKKDSIAEYDRKSDYIYKTMYDFSYGKDIRVYGFKKILEDKFKNYKKERVNISKKIKDKEFIVGIVETVLLLFREGIVYAYLIYSVIYSGMGIGDFTMYFVTIGGFANWMKTILDDIAHIKAQNMYINDFRDFLDISNESNKEKLVDIKKTKKYEIEFNNVSFKYPGSEKYIYKNLSFKIKSGEKLAIVGINGAGKTTLVKLITRLYEPTEGEILLNGVNIKYFNRENYYKLFSVVFQEIKMFAFSVAENIALDKSDLINREKVIECIERATMSEKINSLEKGIDTNILKILDDEGVEFSGGENQRIALARALYKNGPIIILDEPTAALDPVAEYNIYKDFNKLIGNKTAIYISHRLASTRFCDAIAFFENGQIKEYGTHEELLNKGGSYSEMFNVQAQYYKEDTV